MIFIVFSLVFFVFSWFGSPGVQKTMKKVKIPCPPTRRPRPGKGQKPIGFQFSTPPIRNCLRHGNLHTLQHVCLISAAGAQKLEKGQNSIGFQTPSRPGRGPEKGQKSIGFSIPGCEGLAIPRSEGRGRVRGILAAGSGRRPCCTDPFCSAAAGPSPLAEGGRCCGAGVGVGGGGGGA